jgi:hypothetical protein
MEQRSQELQLTLGCPGKSDAKVVVLVTRPGVRADAAEGAQTPPRRAGKNLGWMTSRPLLGQFWNQLTCD